MKRNQKMTVVALGAAIGTIGAAPALASLNYYTGLDVGYPTTHPIGTTARNNWLTDPAVGVVSGLIDFEVPNFTASQSNWLSTLPITTGVQLTDMSGMSNDFRVLSSNLENAVIGFNTTPGGDQRVCFDNHVLLGVAVHEFTFSPPIQAFSMFITGEGNPIGNGMPSTIKLEFNNSAGLQSFVIPQQPIESQFVGFGDLGEAITSVRIVSTAQGPFHTTFSVDDLSWKGIPEPSSLGLLALGAIGMLRRRHT